MKWKKKNNIKIHHHHKDSSTSDINQLIHNIIKSETKIKNGKRKLILNSNIPQSSDCSDIPNSFFKTPNSTRNKIDYQDFPIIKNKINISGKKEKISKRYLNSYIKINKEKKINNSNKENNSSSNEDSKNINQKFILKKKQSFDLNQSKTPNLSLNNKNKNVSPDKIKFKKTSDFILQSKNEKKKITVQSILKNFVEHPFKMLKSIDKYKKTQIINKLSKRNFNNEELKVPSYVKSCKNNNNSKVFLPFGSRKLMKNKIKKRIDIWNLKQNKSHNNTNNNSNINSNYYYNPLFKSDDNQSFERTILRFDNSFSSKSNFSISNLNNKIDKGSAKILFRNRITYKDNIDYKRNNSSSFNFKGIKNISEQKGKSFNIYLKNINIY